MPFTFSHPAAVLPLLRPLGRFGSLSALVIGSTAPDLSFIVPMGLSRAQTHAPAALLTYCLPAGLLAYLAFHLILKLPLLRLSSGSLHDRLCQVAAAPLATWRAVVASLLCGALTHLLWDGFTHQGTVIVAALPFLRLPLWAGDGYTFYVFSALQQLSSVLGLIVLAVWLKRRYGNSTGHGSGARDTEIAFASRTAAPLRPRLRMAILAGFVVIPFIAGLLVAFAENPAPVTASDFRFFFASFIFTALPALATTLFAYALACQVWRRAAP
ncbi:DUF4184 family protein [Massilia sp. CF038]|uniref:DUF4184 family protein n=1 Tax=Massilia sp. CF038 TaxID=1881045 RepID=UPI000918E909|nr:DUF4184 family protein [Massilia sp. CF038]SHH14908.1 protein of unknown function [Massilia sp. CF038]